MRFQADDIVVGVGDRFLEELRDRRFRFGFYTDAWSSDCDCILFHGDTLYHSNADQLWFAHPRRAVLTEAAR